MRPGILFLIAVSLAIGVLIGGRTAPLWQSVPVSEPMIEGVVESEPRPAQQPTQEGEDGVLRVHIPGLPKGARALELAPIPAGTFLMGSTDSEPGRKLDEGPQHRVTITEDYYLGITEITQAQWEAVMGSIPESLSESGKGVGADHPVYLISWDNVQEFLSRLNGLGAGGTDSPPFRLPSEAEWEYACRGGTRTAFYFGDLGEGELECQDGEAGVLPGKRSDYMWYCWSSGENGFPNQTKPVGGLLPNQFGLYDMSGNLWEWCQDWSHSYVNAPDVGTAWEVPATDRRIIRGGCWGNKAKDCRSAVRAQLVPDYRGEAVGFRIARTR